MKNKMYILLCCLVLGLTGCGRDSSSNPGQNSNQHVHEFKMQYQSASSCKEAGKLVEKCNCGHVQTTVLEKAPHNYKERIKEKATCEKAGIKILKCATCSHEIEEEIPQLEHSWKVLRKTDPTCSEDGVESRQCDKCKKKEDVPIPKKTHTLHKEIIESTCTKPGVEQNVCWFCDEVEIIKELPLIAHEYESFEKEPSTCTKTGLLEKICKYCQKKEVTILPKVDHVFIVEEQKATCVEDGYKRMVCEGCEQVANEIIYVAAGHVSIPKTILNPTCDTPGLIEHTCSVCKEVETEEIEPLGHKYSKYERLPTCTEIGYTMRKCDVCGDIKDYNEKPALGHRHIELRRIEPSCIEEGYIEKVCSVCMELSKDMIPKIPHQYELVAEDSEWQHFECTYCHGTKKEKK